MQAFAAVDWMGVVDHLVSLAIAFLLALPIGLDSERHERSAGIRTFPLVAMGACGFVLVAIEILGRTSMGQARIMEGLITGVGFVGGGAILKGYGKASGTATAASLWVTGALGAAVGYGLYDVALILAIVTFATLRGLRPLKRKVASGGEAPAEGPVADDGAVKPGSTA
ncbi:MAG: MgtC/SapB family protein [Pseudomonadota bacterium]